MQIIGRILLGALSLASLTAFLYLSYAHARFLQTSGLKELITWLTVYLGLIVLFCIGAWSSFDTLYRNQPARSLLPRLSRNEDERQIRITKYDQVYGEITRYRDLAWRIGLLAWASYYGLNWVASQNYQLYWRLPYKIFFLGVALTAFSATVFLIYCEHTANRNRHIRREIEEVMGLDREWGFGIERESPFHPSLLISAGIFLLFIWVPVLVMLLFRK